MRHPHVGMEDLDPTPVELRSWGWRTFAMTWMGMVINPASLAEGAALLSIGLTMTEAAVAHLLGGMILVAVLALNAWPGVKYGIPFPVLARSSFGHVGAQFATLTRGAVAIMWLSFQLWQGALGLFAAGTRVFGKGFAEWGRIDEFLTLGQLLLLVFFIALHALAVSLGAARFRSLVYAVAPVQLLGCIAIAIWAASLCSFGDAMRADDRVAAEARAAGGALPGPQAWLAAINSSVGTWSTLVLNVADLSRFAPSQRDQIVGQALGLPLPFGLTGLLGLWVAGASSFAFGEALWQIPQYFEHWPPAAALAGAAVLACSILIVNVIANLLSPMNDMLNVAPRALRHHFKTCGYACLGLALVACPWRIFSSQQRFVLSFLNGYALVTGAVAGVLLTDFWLIRGARLDVAELYRAPPRQLQLSCGRCCRDTPTANWRAFVAVGVGVAPCVPGFVASLPGGSIEQLPRALALVYSASWFVSLGVSSAVFWLLSAVIAAPPDGAGRKRRLCCEEQHGEDSRLVQPTGGGPPTSSTAACEVES